jgi:hypothetical protein
MSVVALQGAAAIFPREQMEDGRMVNGIIVPVFEMIMRRACAIIHHWLLRII